MDGSKSIFLFFYIVAFVKACQIKVCYYRNYAALRPRPYTVTPEILSPQHCDVMIYAFAHVKYNRLTPSLSIDDDSPWTKGLYGRFNDLKSRHKHLITLLSVGGFEFGKYGFANMIVTPKSRKSFIDHAIQFLRQRRFDGLDLYWEYAMFNAGSANNRLVFTSLVQDLKATFQQESTTTGKPRLKLTVALSGDWRISDMFYDVDKISKEVDFVSIMAYDYENPHHLTMHPSPLYGDSVEDTFNIKYAVEYFLQKGIPKSKLVLGLPMYGRGYVAEAQTWNYSTELHHEIEDRSATGYEGILGYFETCRFAESGIRVARHKGVPYFKHFSYYWFGIEDVESMKQKVMFAKRHGLAGIMVWSLDMDDVQKKFCTRPRKNLIETVKETCDSNVPLSNFDPPLSNEDPRLQWLYVHPYPIWKRPEGMEELTDEDATEFCKDKKGSLIFPYPGIDCSRYIFCHHGWGYVETCSPLMAYDPQINRCNWHVFVPKCRPDIYE